MPTKIEKDSVTGQETTGHVWDNIRELNNPLPTWWLWTFYATIVFGIVWMVIYPSLPFWRGTSGWIAREAVVAEVAAAQARNAPMMARLREATPAQIAADPEMRAFATAGGRVAFANNCAACHGAGGQGALGGYPALVDDDWLWGGSMEAIQATIRHGIRNTEDDEARASVMPRFGADGMLNNAQIGDVAEFVLSLSGRSNDAAAAGRGQTIFAENCVACHGENGAGNVGTGAPSLAGGRWIYGGDRATVLATIHGGRQGVMPAWADRLSAAEINLLAVFVSRLRGHEEAAVR